jgi:hypothetical protein
MAGRILLWKDSVGWTCSNCRWEYPLPTLLSAKDARDAYDRLATADFGKHECQAFSSAQKEVPQKEIQTSILADRARMLIMRGYTPKIAVDIVLHELEFEHRENPEALAKARRDAEEFLARIRRGLI